MYQHVNMMICYGLNHKYLSRYHQRSYPRSYLILLVMSTQSNSSNESQIISSLDMQRTHIVNQVQNTYGNSNLHFIIWTVVIYINSKIFYLFSFRENKMFLKTYWIVVVVLLNVYTTKASLLPTVKRSGNHI